MAFAFRARWPMPSSGVSRRPASRRRSRRTSFATFFNDALRLAGVDSVTGKALTRHVTDEMRTHYSTVRLDEKRAAMEAVAQRFREGKVALWVAPSGDPS